jgi:hypothetical protein
LLSQLNPAKDAQGKWLVTPANITSSNVFAVVLAPDVQIFDISGAYAPRKGGNTNDAMSFGIGFKLEEGPWK